MAKFKLEWWHAVVAIAVILLARNYIQTQAALTNDIDECFTNYYKYGVVETEPQLCITSVDAPEGKRAYKITCDDRQWEPNSLWTNTKHLYYRLDGLINYGACDGIGCYDGTEVSSGEIVEVPLGTQVHFVCWTKMENTYEQWAYATVGHEFVPVETYCGDGKCIAGETCSSCPSDCGLCEGVVCGNGVCDDQENNCPEDCGLPMVIVLDTLKKWKGGQATLEEVDQAIEYWKIGE